MKSRFFTHTIPRRPFFVLFMLLAKSAVAAHVWIPDLSVSANLANSHQFLTIENYRYYWNGGNVVLTVRFKEPVNTGCAASDNNRILSYWASPTTVWFTFEQHLLSIVMAAKAQGQKVRVEYDNALCDSVVGRPLHGVEPVILE